MFTKWRRYAHFVVAGHKFNVPGKMFFCLILEGSVYDFQVILAYQVQQTYDEFNLVKNHEKFQTNFVMIILIKFSSVKMECIQTRWSFLEN